MASKVTELRNLADEDLLERLGEAKSEQFNLRFQHVTGQLDNHARLGQVRTEVARLNTLLREREIAAAEALAGSGATEEEGRIRDCSCHGAGSVLTVRDWDDPRSAHQPDRGLDADEPAR